MDITGDIRATGTIYGATKSFDIAHPDSAKKDTHRLRHFCIEGDDIGGAVMYRRSLQCNKGNNTITMPDWFEHLTEDVMCFSSAVHHFGLSWAAQNIENPNEIIVGCSKEGQYNILITAKRKDRCAKFKCPQEIEYLIHPKSEDVKNPHP